MGKKKIPIGKYILTKIMRILSIDGGGYLGLATATFIKETERHFGISFHEEFDMFCGTSTGSIIALALASGMTGAEITEKYESLGKSVFKNRIPGTRFLRTLRSTVMAKYSNKPLRVALEDTFKDLTIGDIQGSFNKHVLITAFQVSSGKPRVFKTDHSIDLTRDNKYLLRQVALASSAAPTYLPVVKLKSPMNGTTETYCDGGVFANHPALLGYAEAVSHLGVPEENIKVLSLSTPRADLAEWESSQNILRRFFLSRGLVFWGSKIFSVMIDSTSIIAHETLRRLLAWNTPSPRYVRVQINKPKGVDMDVTTKSATETLQQIGNDLAYSNEIRNQISNLLELEGGKS
ncbi:MAG: CBASS cGAMP-activated phospholipase [Aridibacter sp.]